MYSNIAVLDKIWNGCMGDGKVAEWFEEFLTFLYMWRYQEPVLHYRSLTSSS